MATRGRVRIAIVGAGLGGAAAAALLQHAGFDVRVYEQAQALARLGAGIHLGPNVMKVMRRLGIERRLREIGVCPQIWVSRKWDTGDVMLEMALGEEIETQYGAPYLTVHRGDFHEVLVSAVASDTIEFGKRLVDLDPGGSVIRLKFDDGTSAEADIVVGADGVNSRIREILLGPERPKYTGYVAHRSIFPTPSLGGMHIPDVAKWWSPDRHLVVYFITRARDELYFVSGVPVPDWPHESSFITGTKEEMRADFAGFHPDVLRLIEASREVTIWPLLEREPLSLWSRGRIVLLGDACHPMKPHMAQGAAMAIEDAAMLARCLSGISTEDFESAFRLYMANRIARTSKVQHVSHMNTWLRDEVDVDWVFGYDVFADGLVPPTPKEP